MYPRSWVAPSNGRAYLPSLALPTCQIESCRQIALGGTCEYKLCFSKGCGRKLCVDHVMQTEPGTEGDDPLEGKVCVECSDRASRAFWLSVLIAIGIPLVLMLPAILLYSAE